MRIFLLLLSILTAADSFCQSHTPSREVEATDDGIIVTYRFNEAFMDILYKIKLFVLSFILCYSMAAYGQDMRQTIGTSTKNHGLLNSLVLEPFGIF